MLHFRSADQTKATMSRESLTAKIAALEKEAARLATTSYSQSDPGAVMERRDVARELRKAYKQLEELNVEHKEESQSREGNPTSQ